jgi:hypothetical protein
MHPDEAVAYSFCMWAAFVCLPLIPALVIFKFFPDAKVSISGPLQKFTVNANGGFAAYIVTVLLGWSVVSYIQAEIRSTRLYAVEGVFLDLGKNQYVGSERFYSQYAPFGIDPSAMPDSRNFNFVVLLDHPVVKSETVSVQYWEINAKSGFSMPPSKSVKLKLSETASRQPFRLKIQGEKVTAEAEQVAKARPDSGPKIDIASERGPTCGSQQLSLAS